MSVEFEEDSVGRKYQFQNVSGYDTESSMSNFLIKAGIVKKPSQARALLVVIAVACIIGAILIYYFYVASANHLPIPASAIYTQ